MISKNGSVLHYLKKPIFGSQETRFKDLGLLHGLTKLQWLNYINDLKNGPVPHSLKKPIFGSQETRFMDLGLLHGLTKLHWLYINDRKNCPCPTFFEEADFWKSRNQVYGFGSPTQTDILTQIGPNVGPFDQSEDADVILDEPNQRQISFKLVKINITTVDFDVMLMSR